MPIKAREVLIRARTVLQDGGSVRWPLNELALWLSDACREVANMQPSSVAVNIVIDLRRGTRQPLPAGYSNMTRAIRNVLGAAAPYEASMAVTPVVREILDAGNPGWHDPDQRPFTKKVYHVIMDPLNPQEFYVYPGNDGTGKLECTLNAIPVDLVVDVGAEPLDLASYNMVLPVSDIYQSALLDYVLYRAFSKDMQFAGSAQRAAAHFQQFNSAMGNRVAQDAKHNVNTTNSQPDS